MFFARFQNPEVEPAPFCWPKPLGHQTLSLKDPPNLGFGDRKRYLWAPGPGPEPLLRVVLPGRCIPVTAREVDKAENVKPQKNEGKRENLHWQVGLAFESSLRAKTTDSRARACAKRSPLVPEGEAHLSHPCSPQNTSEQRHSGSAFQGCRLWAQVHHLGCHDPTWVKQMIEFSQVHSLEATMRRHGLRTWFSPQKHSKTSPNGEPQAISRRTGEAQFDCPQNMRSWQDLSFYLDVECVATASLSPNYASQRQTSLWALCESLRNKNRLSVSSLLFTRYKCGALMSPMLQRPPVSLLEQLVHLECCNLSMDSDRWDQAEQIGTLPNLFLPGCG